MKPDSFASPDTGPDPRLRAALDALPQERALPPDSWTQLQQALSAVPRAGTPRALRPRTISTWAAVAAIAAMLVVTTIAVRGNRQLPPDPLAGLSAEERNDPRVLALVQHTRNWHAAANDSVRSARWPAAARVAVDGALESTDRALTEARAALARDPSDDNARESVAALREHQRSLLEHAMTLLDDI